MAAHRQPKMSLRSLVIDVTGNVFFIALNSTFLALFYPQADYLPADPEVPVGRVCESSVRTYLIGQLLLYILYSLPQRPLQYYMENWNPELKRNGLVRSIWAFWSLMTLFDMVWFFAGQYWTFSSTLCKVHDAPLYWLAVAEIVFFYLSTVIPICLYIALVFISRRRYLRNEREGTGPAAHLKGGLSKNELATLRTFVFRTNLTVSPEEQEDDGDEEKGNSLENGGEADEKEDAEAEDGVEVIELDSIPAKLAHNDPAPAASPALQEPEHGRQDKGKSPVYLSTTPAATEAATDSTSHVSAAESSTASKPDAVALSSAPNEADLPAGAATNCAICFCDFEEGEVIRELACAHIFHKECIDPWLVVPDSPAAEDKAATSSSNRSDPSPKAHRTCPLCVREAIKPEFRDPDVELAMELQKKEDAEMARLLERLKKEKKNKHSSSVAKSGRKKSASANPTVLAPF
ncbi:hypothetical protein BC830DRAFT_382761 [Chytriomyces sp. MP71]|nr:hypothetical protein BC830DRAFT_382761 [Chytriomyces sp. MP71]